MFSQVVMNKVRELQADIPPVNLANPAVFLQNLLCQAAVMKASEALLQDALLHTRKIDAFHIDLHDYFREHYFEELQHYEWLMDDLGLANLPRPDWLAAEMVGAQYYMIKHVHAVALLGYMAVLEGNPMPLPLVAELEALHGTRLLRCARHHAEHDLEHRKELFALIDKVPSDLQSLVMESAVHTVMLIHAAQKTWGQHADFA